MLDLAAKPTALPDDLARTMIPTIRGIAQRLARRLPRHVCMDDLISAGFHGLVTAYARFDAQRGDAFEAYAERRIRGAMLDELRACDPLSRDRRALARRMAAAARKVSGRVARAPRAEEVAAELGLPLDAYWTRLSASAAVVVSSLDDTDGEHASMQVQDPRAEPADELLAHKQRQTAVNRAVAQLPPRLASALELHFGHGLSLKEVGAQFGVSESRICQLVSEAVRMIRDKCGTQPSHAIPRRPASARNRRRSPVAPLTSTPQYSSLAA